MKQIIINIYRWINALGIDLRIMFYSLKSLPEFFIDFYNFKKYSDSSFYFASFYPCLADRYDQSGVAKGHYFHQDLLVAQKIYSNNPRRHLDIGSRVDGFVAHVATYRSIDVIDIRPLNLEIENINFIQMDLMKNLDKALEGAYDSISCLHALEHFGLGRYGDPVNFDGHKIGLCNISKILKKGGILYLSVPLGANRVEFNAHRVFSLAYIISIISEKYTIKNFSYVNDEGYLIKNLDINNLDIGNNYGCNYGCGIFELIRS